MTLALLLVQCLLGAVVVWQVARVHLKRDRDPVKYLRSGILETEESSAYLAAVVRQADKEEASLLLAEVLSQDCYECLVAAVDVAESLRDCESMPAVREAIVRQLGVDYLDSSGQNAEIPYILTRYRSIESMCHEGY